MNKVLILGGTIEGREIADFLAGHQVPVYVCVATEYGEQLLKGGAFMEVSAKRLNKEEMQELLIREQIDMVIDATHPYAVLVSENMKSACENEKVEYLRLLRESDKDGGDITVASVKEAIAWLQSTTGNILAVTGSKELAEYTVLGDYKNRVFARVLSTPQVVEECSRLGFQGKNLICMQGPFNEELNYAMLKQTEAKYLVTKEAGKQGGFQEKLRAAKRAGVTVVVIGRPAQETGLSFTEVKAYMIQKYDIKKQYEVSMIGIGMGTKGNMTFDAYQACERADLFIGADRVLKSVAHMGKPSLETYKPELVEAFLKEHPEYEKIAVLLSGDIGFYSGAKKLYGLFSEDSITTYNGISSLMYLCGKLYLPWEDIYLCSMHGRVQNVISAVRHHSKVFVLTGKGKSVNQLCEKLVYYGLGTTTLIIGENLSYPSEYIRKGTAKELQFQEFGDLSVILIENPEAAAVITHGIPDEDFLRGKVPMTKSEVRSISLSKLCLKRNSIVYDVGAGTGSVAIEMALQVIDGHVYAIEKKDEAVELIKANQQKFCADNLTIIKGLAPEAMEELPAPDCVFIGGSSGNLKEIITLVLSKNPNARIVINAIALETMSEALSCIKDLPVYDVDIATVSVGKSREVGNYHMMIGQNPVYVISFEGGNDPCHIQES